MLSDLRFALRSLSKSPLFALTAILALALGIGANTAIFSVVNSMLLNPVGIHDADRLVAVRVKYSKISHLDNIGTSAADFVSARSNTALFSSVATMQGGDYNFTGGAAPERLTGINVSQQFFSTLGVRPMLGRDFRPGEDVINANHVVILAHSTWQRLFGGDPNIVGRSIELNQIPHRVVGVMAPDFRFPARSDIWVPLGIAAARYEPAARFNQFLFTFARLKPGISPEQASSGVTVMSKQIVQNELKNDNAGGWSIFAVPFVDQIMGPLRTPMLVLLGAVGFVLLIAVSNIAGLLLERASSRSREVALRAALGASPWRLLRPALAESLILSGAGGVLGFVLSLAGVRLLLWLAPPELVTVSSIRLDPWVLLFTATVTLGAGLLFGIAPAWQLSQSQDHNHLKEGGRSATSGMGRQHGRAILVTAEVALALVLLVGATLFLRSLGQLEKVDVGFEPRGVMSAMVGLPNSRYPDDTKRIAFFRAVADRLQSNPAVKSAGMGMPLPFSGDNWSGSFSIEGRDETPGQPGPHGDQRYVSPGYFNAMGIRLVKGRVFTEADRENTDRVMVIDTVLAKTYWPNDDPIGKRIRRGSRQKPNWMTIIGIVEHVRHTELTSDTKGVFYASAFQTNPSVMAIVVEGKGVPGATLSSAIREAVQSVDAVQPVYDFKTMDERVSESLGVRRFAVRLLGFFASFALFMAALGLYGVISYAVTARTQEIGIRVALGAARGQVLSLVVGQGLRLAIAGVLAGLAGAYLLARTLESQLYQVSAFDPLTFLATALVLTFVAVCASALPAFRASRVDPIIALRHE